MSNIAQLFALIKSIPGNAANTALEAKTAAETAAALAAERSFAVSVSNETLTFTSTVEDGNE